MRATTLWLVGVEEDVGPAAMHRQRVVDAEPETYVACVAEAVLFLDDVRAGVEVAGGVAVDDVLDAAAEGVVAVGRARRRR